MSPVCSILDYEARPEGASGGLLTAPGCETPTLASLRTQRFRATVTEPLLLLDDYASDLRVESLRPLGVPISSCT